MTCVLFFGHEWKENPKHFCSFTFPPGQGQGTELEKFQLGKDRATVQGLEFLWFFW